MSKENNDSKIQTPEEQLRELLSTNQFAKKTMQQIFSLIDKSANIDDTKFNQELSKVKKLAYEKGARIDYTPQHGLRDLSVVTKLGNKVDKNEFKKITPEEIKNIIEVAPDKKPSYYKEDKQIDQDKGSITTHNTVDRHSDETFLSRSSIKQAKALYKTQPTKSALKKQVDSIDNPKPKKTVRFGDENGLKIDVRETKSKDFLSTKIDYDALKWGTQKAYNHNLETQIESFVNTFKAHNLRGPIENMVVQYAASKNNDNVTEKTGSALADWAISRNKSLVNGYSESLENRNTAVKKEVEIYRKSIEKDLLKEKASKTVIADVLNEFDKSITIPINSANASKSSALLASRGFEKFGDIIGAPTREKETRTASQINQAQYNNIKDVAKEPLTGDRVAELQAENDNIKSSLTRGNLIALNLNNKLNIPLPTKLKQLQKQLERNNLLIKEYKEIVQPTLRMQVRANQKTLAKEEQNPYPEASFKKDKTAQLIQDKTGQITNTSVSPETQAMINDIVKISPLPNHNPKVLIGKREGTQIIEKRPSKAATQTLLNDSVKTKALQTPQRRPLPARKFPKGQEQNPPVQTSNALASAPITAASSSDRSNIPKSKLAQKQESQDGKKFGALRGSVGLSNNNIASPALNKSSSLPNIKINDAAPSQSTQKPSIEANDLPKPQVNAAFNAIPPSAKQETVLQTQENAGIDALWKKLANRKNTEFLTNGTTKDSPSAEKMKIIRKNISLYKDNIQINNINSSLKLGPVDEDYKKITSKDTKIIDLASKALAEINNGKIEKVDNYLKRIDDIDRGLLKTAAIGANDHILQPLAQKSASKVQELQSERNTNPNKTTIEKAKNIGISMASLINEHTVQKIATSAQAKVNNYRNKKAERGR